MTVVRRHGYAYCQAVEPLSGTGNLPITPEELLTSKVNCTYRSSLIATDQVRKAIIDLPDNSYLDVYIQVKSIEDSRSLLKQLLLRNIPAYLISEDDPKISAAIHLPEFLKLCRNEKVTSIQLQHPEQ